MFLEQKDRNFKGLCEFKNDQLMINSDQEIQRQTCLWSKVFWCTSLLHIHITGIVLFSTLLAFGPKYLQLTKWSGSSAGKPFDGLWSHKLGSKQENFLERHHRVNVSRFKAFNQGLFFFYRELQTKLNRPNSHVVCKIREFCTFMWLCATFVE